MLEDLQCTVIYFFGTKLSYFSISDQEGNLFTTNHEFLVKEVRFV